MYTSRAAEEHPKLPPAPPLSPARSHSWSAPPPACHPAVWPESGWHLPPTSTAPLSTWACGGGRACGRAGAGGGAGDRPGPGWGSNYALTVCAVGYEILLSNGGPKVLGSLGTLCRGPGGAAFHGEM